MNFKQRLFKKDYAIVIAFIFICNVALSQKTFHTIHLLTDSFPAYNLHLYNGSEYRDYDHRIQGTPYFGATGYVNGNITYYNNFYENVPMMYNVVTDDVIIKNYDDKVPVQLVNIKISGFSLNGHSFTRLNHNDSNNALIKTGFYDVLYNGQTQFLCKRKKDVDEKIIQQSIERKFIKKDKYFVFYKSKYEEVNSAGAVLRLLDLKKKPVLKYWKQNKIKHKRQSETAMIAACIYYDNTKNKTAE